MDSKHNILDKEEDINANTKSRLSPDLNKQALFGERQNFT